MQKLLIVPARTGSKRIPNKNFKHFLGKPLIQYAIEKALDSKLFDEVMVSTNDKNAAELCKSYGASVPFLRSEENSNDFATTADVIEEVLLKYGEMGKTFDVVCCLYATSILSTKGQLQEGMHKILEEDFDSLLCVVKYPHPVERALIESENGRIGYEHPNMSKVRTQDLKNRYYDAGQFYFFRANKFLETKKVITDNCGYIEFSSMQVQDIDDSDDWVLAEKKYEFLNYLNNKVN